MMPPPEALTDELIARYPDRKLERGPITFHGPFTSAEINEVRTLIGLPVLKEHPGPHYRNGNYFATVDLTARHSTLMKIFKAFLNEVSL